MKSHLAGRLAKEIARVSAVLALAHGDEWMEAKLVELNGGKGDGFEFAHELIDTACAAIECGEPEVQVRTLRLLENFEEVMFQHSDNRPKEEADGGL